MPRTFFIVLLMHHFKDKKLTLNSHNVGRPYKNFFFFNQAKKENLIAWIKLTQLNIFHDEVLILKNIKINIFGVIDLNYKTVPTPTLNVYLKNIL